MTLDGIGEDSSTVGSTLSNWGLIENQFWRRTAILRQRYTMASYKRSLARNAVVGGAELSQHLVGTAMDFAMRPDQVEAFTASAKALGLTVVNEMNRPGHGAHMHVQMFKAGQVPRGVYRAFGVQLSESP